MIRAAGARYCSIRIVGGGKAAGVGEGDWDGDGVGVMFCATTGMQAKVIVRASDRKKCKSRGSSDCYE